jgi:hypothetical protein
VAKASDERNLFIRRSKATAIDVMTPPQGTIELPNVEVSDTTNDDSSKQIAP